MNTVFLVGGEFIKSSGRTMNDFNSSLNEALKYHTEQERAAFEHRIDEDPLDWQNHLVYSDWLRDNGEEEEADFRKEYGEWVKSEMENNEAPFFVHEPDGAAQNSGFTHGLKRSSVPTKWRQHLPISGYNTDAGSHDATPHIGYGVGPVTRSQPNWIHYRGYRSMEEGMRQAFKASRSKGAK